MIAGAVEGYDNEEEKREEDEDGDAPLPPEMIAELFEAGDDVKQQAAKIPRMQIHCMRLLTTMIYP